MQTNKTKLKLNPQVLLRRPERFLQDLQDFLQRIPARLRNDSETKDDSATKTGWFCNQEWFWNQKKWFWNQGWFRNQGHLETKMAWFSNEAVCISYFFFEASSWLCHLDTCLTLLSYPTPPHPTASGDDAMLSVAASVSKEGTQLPGRYYPTPPHPTASETMPCWVWPQVCQRKERSCQDVIIPPHPTRIRRRCHVECGCKCVRGRNAAARTLLSHPTPPHPPASGDDAMLSVAASVSKEGTQLPGRYYPTPPHPTVSGESHPTPPHPPASGDDAMLSVAASVSKEGTQLPGRYYPTPPHRIWRWCHVECGRKCVKGRNAAARTLLSHPTPPPRIWRRCYVDCGRKCDADVGFWVARMVVAESPFFGCEILVFWLRNRLFLVAESSFLWLRNRFFLVAEAPFLGCGSVSGFGCGIAEIWLRKRRNMVSESEFILPARAPAKGFCSGTL